MNRCGCVRSVLLKRAWMGLAVLALASAAYAQAPVLAAGQRVPVPSRITQPLNENNRITLRGNTHPLARPQFDQGAVADSQPINRMLLLLQRSPDQEAALRELLDQQQSNSSPNYHQWLTPQQFGQQFGPSDADIQTVTSWLQSHGFQVNRVSAGRAVIEFSGNAGQVRGAFNTEIHRFVVNGQEHLANASDPQIPAALASVVAGPVSLHNFGRKPLSRIAGLSRTSPGANGQPELTGTCQSPSGTIFACYVVAPADFATIYNTTALLSSSPSIDGTGQTIAIVADSNINCADIKEFRSFFNLPVSAATSNNDCTQATSNVQVIVDGPDPGVTPDEVEADLDSEWSGAVAPGAHIDLVVSEGTEASEGIDLSAEYILDNNLASVISTSFGACEKSLGNGGAGFYAAVWEQAAAQGMTAMVSTGDSGAAGCDDNSEVVSSQGLAVNGIASTPFDVAVGGTDFNDFTNQTTYWNSTNTGKESVKGYVPEIPWDNSCAASSATGCSGLSISNPSSSLNIIGGGGGESNCLTQTSGACTAGFPKPAWQSGTAVTGLAKTDTVRDIPDVSLFAAAGSGSHSFYPVCEADAPNGAGACPNSFIGVGGTSSSAPAFAGIMAMVNQYMASQNKTARQGNANYVLYPLASQQVTNGLSCNSTSNPNTASSTGCTFYDVTLGSNSVPCVSGTGCTVQNVNANTPGLLEEVTSGNPNGTLAWQAGVGYDMATGLGSVNAFNLVHSWPAVVGLFKPTSTTLQLCTVSPSSGCSSSITITHGATVFVDATVTPSPGSAVPTTPTVAEDIALIGTPNTQSNNGGSTSSAPDRFLITGNSLNVDIYPLKNGTTVGTGESTNFLIGGTYSVIAHYTGDGTFGASDSLPVSVTVNPESSRTTLSFLGALDPTTCSTRCTIVSSTAYGLPDLLRVDVVGVSSGQETATGNVTVTDNNNPFGGTGCCALNSEGYLEVQSGVNLVPTLSVGAHSFAASYGGDAGYLSSASTPLAITVTAAPTTVMVSSSKTTVSSGGSVTLTATVATDSIGAAPGGTVAFFANGVQIAAGMVNYAQTSGSLLGNPPNGATVLASVIATLTYSPPATTTITAMYNAGSDANYTSSSLSSGVTLTVPTSATFSISSPNNSSGTAVAIAAPGGSGSSTLTITSLNSFAGTVTLSCSVAPVTINEPTCGFAGGNTVNLTPNTSQTKTLTLSTTAASALPVARPDGGLKIPPVSFPVSLHLWWILALTVVIAAFSLASLERRRHWGYLWFAGLLLMAMTQWSCASKSSGSVSSAGTPTNTYTVTVSGTSGSTSATPASVFFNLQ